MSSLKLAKKLYKYLGYTLTPQESYVLGQIWNEDFYPHKDIVTKARLAYSVDLPSTISNCPEKAQIISKLRRRDFYERMITAEMFTRLINESLEKILSEEPHKFVIKLEEASRIHVIKLVEADVIGTLY